MSSGKRWKAKRHNLIEGLESRTLFSGGVLDTSFSTDGKTSFNFGGGISVTARDAVVDASGKTIVFGDSSDGQFALARFNSDGSIDTTFGTKQSGRVLVHMGPKGSIDTAAAIVIDGSGNYVVVGQSDDTSAGDNFPSVAIARFLPTGALDKSFNGTGTLVTDALGDGQFSYANDVVIAKSGKIDVLATVNTLSLTSYDTDMFVAQYNTNGSLDKSFGDGGSRDVGFGGDDVGDAMAIDTMGTASNNSDYGNIIIAGINYTNPPNTPDLYPQFAIGRLTPAGNMDKSFSSDGKVTYQFPGEKVSKANAVTIESGGEIVAAGTVGTVANGTNHDFGLVRFNSKGVLDTSFGTNGHTITNIGGDDYATSMVIGGFGEQLVVGGASSGKFALAAYSLDGHLDTGFGTNGLVTTKVDNSVSNGILALSPNHTITVAGGKNFNVARYTDIAPVASINTAADVTHEGGVVKRIGKFFEIVPDPATMVVSLDESVDVDTKVYFTIGGTANRPDAANKKLGNIDYTLTNMTIPTTPVSTKTGYVIIPAGQTSVSVTFTAVNDTIPEPTETASFTIAPNADYAAGNPASQTISILDDDSPAATVLKPTADSYVQDGTNANTNFGKATQLVVKKSGTVGDTREAFFTFDLSSVSSVNNVTLSLFGALNNTTNTNLESDLYGVATTSWTETGLTYNNRPSAGSSKIASAVIVNTTAQTYTFDITAYVQAQFAAGHKVISLELKNPVASGSAFLINSREASSNQPALTIT